MITSGGETPSITLFLGGDVMTGRGIDQILPHPGDDRLHEAYISSAVDYVHLAERANGPIHRPVGFDYIWGPALTEFRRRRLDARIINLETAVTDSTAFEPKGIHYKMSPANLPVLEAAGVDCCVIANNHVLDWGRPGLAQTLSTLKLAGVHCAGAGPNAAAAAAPAVLEPRQGTRILVFGFASPGSGVPHDWAADAATSGVNLLPSLTEASADRIAQTIHAMRTPGDLTVASIHWSENWGYDIAESQTRFAHRLIDAGAVDLVHGHSSHHFKAIEVYQGRLILHGCGDFINDYEGITGYEDYRSDLVLMYFPALRTSDSKLAALELVPLQIRNMRLNPVSKADRAWIVDRLNRECARFGTCVTSRPDGALQLEWIGSQASIDPRQCMGR